MSDYIGNDIIDTRDLIKELEEMKREREGLEEALEEAKEALADLEADEDATEEDLQCAREAERREGLKNECVPAQTVTQANR